MTSPFKVKNSLGISIGASSLSFIRLNNSLSNGKNSNPIVDMKYIQHYGKPNDYVSNILSTMNRDNLVFTGRKHLEYPDFKYISEIEAIEYGLKYLSSTSPQTPPFDAVISLGAESIIVYQTNSKKNSPAIIKAYTGNKCASGTGEFFLQQIKRMSLSLNEAMSLALIGNPYNISGRCSVFCKSDCTHALNKGVPKEDVVAGLTKMVAQKIVDLTSKFYNKRALVIGGVSQNRAVIEHLQLLNKVSKNFISIETIPESYCFEALGAAWYAFLHQDDSFVRIKSVNNLFRNSSPNESDYRKSHFSFLSPLLTFQNNVEYKEVSKDVLEENVKCILGLDVGSTTTKAVLINLNNSAIVASEYLRTNGDPIFASVECYKSIKRQYDFKPKIVGLGITGSGRHISGIHALSDSIINEIIAHSTATTYFDPEADTIFEIGGQDAKYTFLTAGVPSDYAMNEACSAGTGSFLEEAASETLNIDYLSIGELAIKSLNPPNFNDQCSAFISSDIKTALQEGISKEDILAGLVYSICLNYSNRVKGNRKTGKKVFMQGGVCYNKAVPLAMAAITGKRIIVPPEPGLMGAFGVALEVKRRIELGFTEEKVFDLDVLISRKVEYETSFICAGGKEKCDRKCNVSIISVDNKKFPFGGACDKYYSIVKNEQKNNTTLNYVSKRQELIFGDYYQKKPDSLAKSNNNHLNSKSIGISKSLLSNTYFPLFYNFFNSLGLNIIIGDINSPKGVEKKSAPFCFPVEIAHGFFQDLIDKNPDYFFLPHIQESFKGEDSFYNRTCVLVQSEAYYLRASFKKELENKKILSPVFNFSSDISSIELEFQKLSISLGFDKTKSQKAFARAISSFYDINSKIKKLGNDALANIQSSKYGIVIVLLGRSYNAMADEANMGIPQKISSRGITIIPFDSLDFSKYHSYENMYWDSGKLILQATRLIKESPVLFPIYITNFSCGPDSIILHYFHKIMENKPHLVLELDSHSADAGINTRIEAFIDIILRYKQLNERGLISYVSNEFTPLKVIDSHKIIDSKGIETSIFDKNVKIIIPSMGRFSSEAFAAAFIKHGINSEALPIYDFNTLALGRSSTSCKECLPLILNSGALLNYYKNRDKNEKTIFFMPKGTGPCRFGQYHVFLNDLIQNHKLENTGVYSLTDEDSYGGLGNSFVIRGWIAITVGDAIQNLMHSIKAIAENPDDVISILEDQWENILYSIKSDKLTEIYKKLKILSEKLKQTKQIVSYQNAVKVALIGEIYVRHDDFSRRDLLEKLYNENIIVKVAPIGEYVYYSNYIASSNEHNSSKKIMFWLRDKIQRNIEKKVYSILSKSGYIGSHTSNIKEVISKGSNYINDKLYGEAILTVGSAFDEIINNSDGIIAIGPFGCMPSRVAESILTIQMNLEEKLKTESISKMDNHFTDVSHLPFLSIETDGNPFPQIIRSKIEIFILQAKRLHKKVNYNSEIKSKVLH